MKIGAVVRLRSGSPPLTITHITDGVAVCGWFEKFEYKFAHIPLAALELDQ